MHAVLDLFNGFAGDKFKGKGDNDFFDRLSCRYTLIILLVCGASVGFYQVTGDAIMCWVPVHFHSSHTKFANNFCWIKNTYWLPYEREIPREEESGRQMVVYYQWVPFILLVQALLFFCPSLVWNAFNQKGGVDADNILEASKKLMSIENEENREGVVYLIVKQLDRFFGTRRDTSNIGGSRIRKAATAACHGCGSRFSSYLVTLFLFSKLLYIANVFFQLYILNRLLGTDYSTYGFDVMRGLVEPDHRWTDSGHVVFPRVTMCDFPIRRLGNIHRYTLQCALPLNLFNEKIFIFLWFWFVFVLVASILGFLQCLIRSMVSSDRLTFIQNHLRAHGRIFSNSDKKMSENFVQNYLQQDGVFIFRLISHNTNNITTGELISAVWDNWGEGCTNGNPEKSFLDDILEKRRPEDDGAAV